MRTLLLLMAIEGLFHAAVAFNAVSTDRSREPFSSSFRQPQPPTVKSEFSAHYNQHKWDANISNIASGVVYHSLSQKRVRLDLAADPILGSSLFDYTNVTEEGVLNRLWTLGPAVNSAPECSNIFVNPSFPLISEDILTANDAIYGGLANDAFAGEVTLWDILYQGTIPVTILLGDDNVIQGYNFLGVETRARVITRFFNIVLRPLGDEVFDFPC